MKVHLEQPGGAEVILAVLGPGEVVGEMSLADSSAMGVAHPVDALCTPTRKGSSLSHATLPRTRVNKGLPSA